MNNNSELSLFSDDEIRDSKDRMVDLRLDTEDAHLHLSGVRIVDQDFRRYSMQRSNVRDSDIIGTNFDYAAATGSRFKNTTFEDCILDNASFQCCDFEGVNISSSRRRYVSGSNFSQSNIVSSLLDNIWVKASSFSQCYFLDSMFRGCHIRSCTFENSIFDSCKFIDTDMVRLNMEFIKFKKDNVFDNVELSMHQIPYMVGFREPLEKGKKVHAVAYKRGIDGKTTKISYGWSRYKEMLMDLARIYYGRGELYPVANILYNLGDTEGAHAAVMEGLRQSLFGRDFRMVRHFCDVGTEYGLLGSEDKRSIGTLLSDSMRQEKSMEVVNKYLIYSGEIQSLLDRNGSMDRITMTVYTTIDSDDNESVQYLVEDLMKFLNDKKGKNDKYTIRISHNCDLDLIIDIITDGAPVLLNILYSFLGNVAYEGYKRFRDKHRKDRADSERPSPEPIVIKEKVKETTTTENVQETEEENGIITSCSHRVITTKEYEREVLIGGKDYRSAERPHCSDTSRMEGR